MKDIYNYYRVPTIDKVQIIIELAYKLGYTHVSKHSLDVCIKAFVEFWDEYKENTIICLCPRDKCIYYSNVSETNCMYSDYTELFLAYDIITDDDLLL